MRQYGENLSQYGFSKAKVEVVHADSTSKEALNKLSQVLIENEKSAKDFLVINFLQSEYTGDPEGAVGHIAPVAAYDQKTKQVLGFILTDNITSHIGFLYRLCLPEWPQKISLLAKSAGTCGLSWDLSN